MFIQKESVFGQVVNAEMSCYRYSRVESQRVTVEIVEDGGVFAGLCLGL
jgi:hypothetical protein